MQNFIIKICVGELKTSKLNVSFTRAARSANSRHHCLRETFFMVPKKWKWKISHKLRSIFKNKSPLNHIFAHLQRVNVGQKAPKRAEWALLNHLG